VTYFFLDRSDGNLSKKIAVSLVEKAFRTLKGVDLKIRPIHHWLEKRVRAHIFLCMLAYYVEWHLRESWKGMIFTD
jgi:transposase